MRPLRLQLPFPSTTTGRRAPFTLTTFFPRSHPSITSQMTGPLASSLMLAQPATLYRRFGSIGCPFSAIRSAMRSRTRLRR